MLSDSWISHLQLWWKEQSPLLYVLSHKTQGLINICLKYIYIFLSSAYKTPWKALSFQMSDMGIDVKSSCKWVVYTNPSGHGNFARDLFVWEQHWNTSLPVPALKPTQWIAIVPTQYPAAHVYTHWRRPSSSEITSSHYLVFFNCYRCTRCSRCLGKREIA